MEQDLITVVIPVYKVEKYISKCVNSIVNQTYKKLEIILVDDGSPDTCGNICDDFSKKDDRIVVVHKKNGGLSDARNCGLEIAKGKYICFVDSDDYIDEKYISILYTNLLKTKADISIIGYQFYYENHEERIKSIPVNKPIIIDSEKAISYLFRDNKIGNYAWNKMYKIELFENIRYPKGKKMEDLGTTYKLFDKCTKIVFSNIELYYYLQRNDSILHSADTKLCNDKFQLSYDRYEFILNHYPNMKESKKFMFENALRLYPFLIDKHKKNADYILSIKVKDFKLSKGNLMRYFIYKLSKKVYSYIFLKRGIKG
ncbi:MAG: glycosyltransferase family 2 protein [Bacilli bacterium]|nr:glycosyltransferase family 2 protein [Bacilli bacterium]